MRLLAALCLASLLLGCSSSRRGLCGEGGTQSVTIPGDGRFGNYVGPPQYNQAIRKEMRRQFPIIKRDPDLAGYFNVEVILIEPVRVNDDGRLGTMPNGSLLHAQWQGAFQSFDVTFWFAACPDDAPYLPHVSHEVGHLTLVVFGNVGGHPTEFEIDGIEYTSERLLLSDARWPMRVARGTWRILTPWKVRTVGDGFRDAVNGKPHVGGFVE